MKENKQNFLYPSLSYFILLYPSLSFFILLFQHQNNLFFVHFFLFLDEANAVLQKKVKVLEDKHRK